MGTLGQEIRYALRNLGKSPGFAIVAVVTLALGIGASTAIFSVVDNILMEPFPYPDAQRFMSIRIHDTEKNQPGGRARFPGPEYLEYAKENHVFDRVIAAVDTDVLYRSGEGSLRFHGAYVTPGTFEFLGMPASLGRVMQPADYEPGAPPVFILRYKTWVKEFAADPQIVNRTFILNGVPRILIGIMPPRFAWWGADIWIPDRPSRTFDSKEYAGAFPRSWFLLGHLKPGVSKKQAEADLTVVAKRMAAVYPKDYPKHFTLELRSLADGVVGQFQTTIFIVLAAVGLLLLIGCGNVANLLLARATTREKEFAIRAALGASRWRLARQLLVESSVLALGGAALGTLVAWGGLKSLVALVPEDTIPAEAVIRLNGAVLLFTLGLAAFTALVFGLAPAIKAAHKDVNEPLRDSSKGSGGGFRHGKLRNAVVVLEVALSLTLLVRLKALPGVVDATETSALPPYGGIPSDIEIPGKTHTEKWNAPFQLCSEGYFSVLKIQFLDGRDFTEAEVAGARKLAVVNQMFVKKYLGGENPIGKQVRIAQLAEFDDPVKEPLFEIIGLVADVKNQGLQDPITPEVWTPYTVTGSAFRGILVRTAGEPLTLVKP